MDEVAQDNITENLENVKIGKFKPKRQFLNFVAAVNGTKIRLISDSAFIKGEKLSGILEGVKLKFTLRDNGTVDVEEIDSSKTDDAMIGRLIDDIDEIDVTGYAHKFIVHGLEFENEKGERCYLEVEHQKPYDKLKSLFDTPVDSVLSDNASNFLDKLFTSDSDSDSNVDEIDSANIEEEEIEKVETKTTPALSYMEESFLKMNEQKVNELKSRIEEAEKNINKFKRDIAQSERSINSESDRLNVLNTRLETFNVKDESIGYVFQVSDAKQSERELNDVEKSLISDVAKVIKADENMLVKLLSNTMFVIKLSKKDNFEDKTLTNEIFDKLKQIDLNATLSVNADGDIEYYGKMNWHQVVDKLIKKGFEQDPEFEKFVGSNSYQIEKADENSDDLSESHIVKLDDTIDDVSTVVNSNKEFNQRKFRTYDEPTDLVILGTLNSNEVSDIEITDDFVSLQIRIDGDIVRSIETDGFTSIITLDEYKKWHQEMINQGSLDGSVGENNSDFGIDAILLQDFKGIIGIGVFSEKLGYVTEFDETSFIHHEKQFDGDYPDVFINFDTDDVINMHDIINHDLNKIIPYMRDVKLEKVLK